MQTIPNDQNDPRVGYCGHNFPMDACPYQYCLARSLWLLWQEGRKFLADLQSSPFKDN